MKSVSHLAIAAAGVLTLGGLVGGGIVFAADRGDSSPGTTITLTDQQGLADDFLSQLAANLGIDVQKLKDAIKQTSLDQLDRAVADGKISKEMADKIRQGVEQGSIFGLGPFGKTQGGGPNVPGGHGGFDPGFGLKELGASVDSLAKFLGISTDQLKTELQGKSLAEVAQAHGKSRDDLKQFLIGEATTRLDKAVADGKLPKEVAEKIKAGLSAQIDHLIDAKLPNGQFNLGPGPKRMPGNGSGQPFSRPNRSSTGPN